MKIKLTVELAESEGNNHDEESRKVLLLAQKGIIEKYAARLMSAGTTYMGNYASYGRQHTTYIEVSNTDQSIEVK